MAFLLDIIVVTRLEPRTVTTLTEISVPADLAL
jgi:hypothetical protein